MHCNFLRYRAKGQVGDYKEMDRIPDQALSFETNFRGCREELVDTVDRVMRVVQTLPFAQGRLDDLHLALLEAHDKCADPWESRRSHEDREYLRGAALRAQSC